MLCPEATAAAFSGQVFECKEETGLPRCGRELRPLWLGTGYKGASSRHRVHTSMAEGGLALAPGASSPPSRWHRSLWAGQRLFCLPCKAQLCTPKHGTRPDEMG